MLEDIQHEDRANALLKHLSDVFKLPEPITLDDQNIAYLLLDESLYLIFELTDDLPELTINAVLGSLPEHNSAPTMRRLLQANYFWNQTEGATLALDPSSSALCLLYPFPLIGTTPDDFTSAVEKIANAAQYWTQQLELEHAHLPDDPANPIFIKP